MVPNGVRLAAKLSGRLRHRILQRFAAEHYTGSYDTGTPVPEKDLDYGYDYIGNRTDTTVADGEAEEQERLYDANVLNQYTRLYVGGSPAAGAFPVYDEDGNLLRLDVAGDMNCDGVVNLFDVDPFVMAMTNPTLYAQTYPNCDIMHADLNGDGVVNLWDNNFMAVNGSIATQYVWDGENRLVRAEPARTPQGGDRRVSFAYDYRGRRVQKLEEEYVSGQWSTVSERKFVWSGWLMMMELDGNDDVVRRYTWGLDLAGQNGALNSLEGAGGIGGLLAIDDDGESNEFLVFYDANGNVTQLIDWSDDAISPSGTDWDDAGGLQKRLVAHYEYDPYGAVVNDISGYAYAETNSIRFSTKYFDAETGLGYWGYRYYSPRLGRWISRDPIGEKGGIAVYVYNLNRGAQGWDLLGHSWYDGVTRSLTILSCACGPDVTDWLVDQMNTNARSEEVKEIRKYADYWRVYNLDEAVGATAALMEAYLEWARLVGAGMRWDFKVSQRRFRGTACPSVLCPNTVTLCGKCYYYDVPGNIHYGFVGRAAGIPISHLHLAGDLTQRGGPDEPGDALAIDIGYELHLGLLRDEKITRKDLCQWVNAHSASLNGPNHANPRRTCPGIPCTFEKWK